MSKKYSYGIVGLTLIIGLLGCGASTATPLGKQILPSRSDKIIEDSFGHYRIYRRSDKSYYVYQNGRIIYDRLKFVTHATLPGKNNMQALDQHNKLLTFSLTGNAEPGILFCGVGVANYRIDISKKPDGFALGVTLTGGDVENFSVKTKKLIDKVQPITTVSKNSVDDLYFANHAKSIKFEGHMGRPQSMLYYRVGDKHGVYGKLRAKSNFKYRIIRQNPKRYDEIDFVGDDVYVRNGTLWGCIGKTAVKYRKLSPFVGKLARFELPDSRRGYVTDKGVEYED